MAIDFTPSPPCPESILADLREAAVQLQSLMKRIEGYDKDREPGQLYDAQRLATTLRATFAQAACDTHAFADHELSSPALPTA